MKKIFNIILLLCVSFAVNAQDIDRSVVPSAAPAKALEIKDAQTFSLPNGLKVFVVEDHRAPVIFYSVMLDIDPALEGSKAGMQDMFMTVIGTGTKNRSKEQLSRETDLIGARISSDNRGGHAGALKKHDAKLLELFSDILLNPVFTQKELDINLDKERSGLKMLGDDAGSINKRLSAALTYGKGYPSGELTTAESLDKITVQDLENYHKTYFAPNVARLVIVGDISLAEAKANAEKYFGKWAKKKVPVSKYTIPSAPEKTQVAFYNKPGAVQSSIDVSYPVQLRTGAPDQLAAGIMAYIMGGGSEGRLFQNLREKHSYTYGVYNILSPGDLTGRYSLTAGRGGAAQVKATATDSAIYFIEQEMRKLINTPVSEQELKNAKTFMIGSFGRSLEDASTIANFAVNIDKYKLPKNYYKTYLQRLDAVTVADVQAAAKKYLRPDNAWIVVTGDKSHAEGLKQFNGNNSVQFYDINANPIAAPETKTADVSAEQIIANYVKALGGADAINAVNDYTITGSINAMGQVLSVTQQFKQPNLTSMSMGMQGMIVQKIVFTGNSLKISGMGGNQEFTEGKEFEAAKTEAGPCPEMNLIQNGYKLTVKGIEKVGNTDAYVMDAEKSSVKTYWFDTTTGLLLKTSATDNTPQGPVQQVVEYSDYRAVNGVLFPFSNKQKIAAMEMNITVESVKVNTGLDDALFQ